MKLEDLETKLGIANLGEEEKLALVKDIQANLPALKAEQRSLEAKTQANLVVEAIKKIKEGLEARFDELNGIVDVKVRDITSGKDGLQGPKGEQGDRGFDGTNGKDGYNGKDGIDGVDGQDGVGVQDAYIDFDGSLIIKLTDGKELNVGEVVPMDVAEKIKVIGNGGGTSQVVLDAIAALQATIATYGTMALQNKTSVDIEGGTIDNTVIGAVTPAAGTFTTLGVTTSINAAGAGANVDLNVNSKGTGNVKFSAGTNEQVRIVDAGATTTNYVYLKGGTSGAGNPVALGGGTSGLVNIFSSGGSNILFTTNGFYNVAQLQVSHTASAVNYVQVTGAATTGNPEISAQGSDAAVSLNLASKSTNPINLRVNGATQFQVVNGGSSIANRLAVQGGATSVAPVLASTGSDTNIPLVLQPKGTGALQAQQTDSTATGGNARGANAVDWQTSRGAAGQVASGAQSVLAGGSNNTSSSQYGTVSGGAFNGSLAFNSTIGGGASNSAQGNYSAILAGANNQTLGAYGSTFAGIVAGAYNQANGVYNLIGGGFTNSGTSASTVTTQSGTMNGTTAVTLSGSNASIKVGQYITGTSISGDTYVAAISGTSLTLSKVASGSSTSTLSFYTPHGVVVGGGNNQATGSYSFIGGGGDAGTAANRNVASGDWSTIAGGVKNVASGAGSVVAGGGYDGGNFFGNTSSGSNSFIGGGILNAATNTGSVITGGWQNIANGNLSTVVGGRRATTRSIVGNTVFAANENPIADVQGASQGALLVLGTQTTDATATVLRSNTSAAATTNQVILPNNSAYYFKGTVVAGVTGGGNTKGWTVEGVIKRGANAASTAIVGTATVTSSYADAGASTWALTATADTTNGGLAITFTGQASTTIRVVAKIETTEMTY